MTSPPADPGSVYRQRRDSFAARHSACVRRSQLISNLRFVTFLAALAALGWLLDVGVSAGSLPAMLTAALSVVFLVLIAAHAAMQRRCRWFDELRRLNEEGEKRLARDWRGLAGRDLPVPDDPPPFAEDLDLFGHASLFSLLGTVGTPQGRATLTRWLLEPAGAEAVSRRQAAVAELTPRIELREELTVRGRLISEANPEGLGRFLAWAEGPAWLRGRPALVWVTRILPLLTVAFIALNVLGLIPYTAWALMLVFNLGIGYTVGRKAQAVLEGAFSQESAFQEYAELLERVSETELEAPLLRDLQGALVTEGVPAHRHMVGLHRLLGLAEIRLSMIHPVLMALALWDFHVLWWLESWQLANGRRARDWLDALGELDSLAALAALRFDNPGWAFPEVGPVAPPSLEAQGLGHPLLADGVRVPNDVHVGPPGRFLFITGSNMSGKSTLLRAIGTNVVLARAGAPVCATAMRLPPLAMETCMRVDDSLQAGLSHFMAELQRLKRVVESARSMSRDEESVLLYLLDDILQGTNTAERQIAARKIITRLLSERAIGAVTSHDLALADTPELSGARDAVYLSERIEEGDGGIEISFDYRLRQGVATTRNALKLLKLVGLDAPSADARSADTPPDDTPPPDASSADALPADESATRE